MKTDWAGYAVNSSSLAPDAIMQYPLLSFQNIMFSQFTAVERSQTVGQRD